MRAARTLAALLFLAAWHIEVALRREAPARWFDRPTRALLGVC